MHQSDRTTGRTRKHASERPAPADVDPVRLRPVLGLEPGKWLTFLLAGVLLLIVLGLLLIPGITNRHVVYRFESTPAGASVHVDGVRIGATPIVYEVPAGTRTIRFARPFFEPEERVLDVGGRIIGSLFFPARADMAVSLGPDGNAVESAAALTAAVALEFSYWSALGVERPDRPIPELLVPSVADLRALGIRDDDIQSFLVARVQDVTSAPLLRDLLQALAALNPDTQAPELSDTDGIVSFFRQFRVNSHTWMRWLSGILPTDASQALRSDPRYEQELAADRDLENDYPDTVAAAASVARSRGRLTAGGVSFQPVPAGDVLLGFSGGLGVDDRSQSRQRVSVDEFFIATRPVSVGEFSRFLQDSPEWSPASKEQRAADGLVDHGYLEGFDAAASDLPVTGVSWHAAMAYLSWFNARYASELAVIGPGVEARLPVEAEWAWAAALDRLGYEASAHAFSRTSGPAALNGERSGRIGLEDMLGNVWEWTADPWYRASGTLRLEHEVVDTAPGNLFPRVVRGGSWANPRAAVGIESRGGQNASWATPFLGFRIVLAAVD